MRQALVIKRLRHDLYELMEDFHSECGITVPAGFRSDGISLPRGFRWIVAPTGLGFNAALVHDCLLYQDYSWEVAVTKFEEQLVHDDVPYWRKKAYVWGVRLWGGLKRIGG